MWIGEVKEIERHLESCDHEMVLCEYHKVGYAVKMCHKRKREHEEEHVKDHLEMTKCKLTATQKDLGKNWSLQMTGSIA